MSKVNQAPEGAIRIQKFLSLAGVSSRRHAEELVAQGRVKVSGRVVTEMGTLVVPGKSRVEVDNKPVFYNEERNYVLFHKPAECITTLDDPEHRTTVIDLLPKGMPRLFPVGRLDWDTEGLLLLTNVKGDKYEGGARPRLIMAIASVVSIALIMMSMLLGVTPVSSDYIQGIQGRYFLPLAPMMFMITSNDMIVVQKKQCCYIWLTRMAAEIMVVLQCVALTA